MHECMISFFILNLLLQIILALGNYMNSSKRGAVYGFKLQSLDLVSCSLLPFNSTLKICNKKKGFKVSVFSFTATRHQVYRP